MKLKFELKNQVFSFLVFQIELNKISPNKKIGLPKCTFDAADQRPPQLNVVPEVLLETIFLCLRAGPQVHHGYQNQKDLKDSKFLVSQSLCIYQTIVL